MDADFSQLVIRNVGHLLFDPTKDVVPASRLRAMGSCTPEPRFSLLRVRGRCIDRDMDTLAIALDSEGSVMDFTAIANLDAILGTWTEKGWRAQVTPVNVVRFDPRNNTYSLRQGGKVLASRTRKRDIRRFAEERGIRYIDLT